ncbi:MAG: hypothetical protein HP495_08150 [Nitrospira sp.]|nr:hypothetical protein [Nitrospira sp.]
MTTPTSRLSAIRQWITVCMLAGALGTEFGCVSRSAYERVKAEAQEHAQALQSVHAEVKELDQQIAGLQAANRHEDAATAELRAALQREEEQLPVMRQRAEMMLTSLKGQVASLMNQSWNLARKIPDLRHESASLQNTAAQYNTVDECGSSGSGHLVGRDDPQLALQLLELAPQLRPSASFHNCRRPCIYPIA